MRANLSAYRNTFSEQYAFRNTFHYFVLYIMNSSNTVNAEFSIFSKKHQIPPFIVFVKSVHYLSEIQNIKNIENKVFVRPSRCSSFSCASFSLLSRFVLASFSHILVWYCIRLNIFAISSTPGIPLGDGTTPICERKEREKEKGKRESVDSEKIKKSKHFFYSLILYGWDNMIFQSLSTIAIYSR